MRDIHEVFGDGLQVPHRGWRAEVVPGRHPFSSAYLWYVHYPSGGLVEYYADEEWYTASWEARAWKRTLENFAQWAVTGGLDGNTRRQSAPPPK